MMPGFPLLPSAMLNTPQMRNTGLNPNPMLNTNLAGMGGGFSNNPMDPNYMPGFLNDNIPIEQLTGQDAILRGIRDIERVGQGHAQAAQRLIQEHPPGSQNDPWVQSRTNRNNRSTDRSTSDRQRDDRDYNDRDTRNSRDDRNYADRDDRDSRDERSTASNRTSEREHFLELRIAFLEGILRALGINTNQDDADTRNSAVAQNQSRPAVATESSDSQPPRRSSTEGHVASNTRVTPEPARRPSNDSTTNHARA